MNELLIFLVRVILGIFFGVILIRVFRPDWGIYHGIATGLALVSLSYILKYYREKKS